MTIKAQADDIEIDEVHSLNRARMEELEINDILYIFINEIRQDILYYENCVHAQPLMSRENFLGNEDTEKENNTDSNSDFKLHLQDSSINNTGGPQVTKYFKMYFFLSQLTIPFQAICKCLGDILKCYSYGAINIHDFLTFLGDYSHANYDKEATNNDNTNSDIKQLFYQYFCTTGVNTISAKYKLNSKTNMISLFELIQNDDCLNNFGGRVLREHSIDTLFLDSRGDVEAYAKLRIPNNYQRSTFEELQGLPRPKAVLVNANLGALCNVDIDEKTLKVLLDNFCNFESLQLQIYTLNYLEVKGLYRLHIELCLHILRHAQKKEGVSMKNQSFGIKNRYLLEKIVQKSFIYIDSIQNKFNNDYMVEEINHYRNLELHAQEKTFYSESKEYILELTQFKYLTESEENFQIDANLLEEVLNEGKIVSVDKFKYLKEEDQIVFQQRVEDLCRYLKILDGENSRIEVNNSLELYILADKVSNRMKNSKMYRGGN